MIKKMLYIFLLFFASASTTRDLISKSTKDLILFDYEQTDLSDIITQLATKKNLNIQFPTQADAIKTKITYTHPKKLNLADAWNLTLNFLEIAGYSIVPVKSSHDTERKLRSFEIVKNKKFISKNLKLYIDTDINKLPNNDNPIRYVYYFKNITLTAEPEAQKELASILSNILPSNTERTTADTSYGAPASASDPGIQFDSLTNCLILSNRANCIRQVMEIVRRLDDSGFKETVLMISLNYTDATRIEKMVEELIKEQGDDNAAYGYRPPTAKKISSPKYLQNVKAIAVDRTNSIILMGDAAAVLKLKGLILDNLDQPVESGKSIIHIRRLQYLDAKTFAVTLQNIVRGKRQQTAQPGTNVPHDTMKEVIIVAEETGPVQRSDPNAQQDAKMVASFQEAASSGNNLIIAAHDQDWKVLERIIEEMDKPQLQVALEVIIADLKLSDSEILGAQARAIHRNNLSPELSWQSAQMAPPILNYVGDSKNNVIDMTKALDANLLTGVAGVPKGIPGKDDLKLIDTVAAGATVLSFNDGNGIAYVMNLLNSNDYTKVLSQPFLVTQNHKNAVVELESIRLVPGGGQSQSGSWILKTEKFTAILRVNIMPSISNDGKNINLNIKLKVDEFVSVFTSPSAATSPEINTREIITNSNLTSGDVLVLGGLTRTDTVTTMYSMPLLSKIPIIGNLFKQQSQKQVKSTLVVFISPKIIQSRTQGGLEEFSEHKLGYGAKETIAQGHIFDDIKDPITRFIFPKIGNHNLQAINNFAGQSMDLNPPRPPIANAKRNDRSPCEVRRNSKK